MKKSLPQVRKCFHRMAELFEQVERCTEPIDRFYRIVDYTFRLRFTCTGLLTAVAPALSHLEVSDPPKHGAEVTFHLWDSDSTAVNPPLSPFDDDDYRRYGGRALLDDGAAVVMHDPVAGTLCAYDRNIRKGFFWTSSADALSIYERGAPLQTLFHWALEDFDWRMVHAAAVGFPSGGALLVGNSGAGKTTAALSCLHCSGLRYLCDDKCLVCLNPRPQAFAIFNSAKPKADVLEKMPRFRPLINGWDGLHKAGKSLMFMHPTYADDMIARFPVCVILILRITHRRRPRLVPAGSGDAFRVLGPSSVIWLPGAERSGFQFLAGLAKRVPCRFLDLARDPEDNVKAVQNALWSCL